MASLIGTVVSFEYETKKNSHDNHLLDVLDLYLLRTLRFHTLTLNRNLGTSEILPRLVSFWKPQFSYVMTSNLVTCLIIQFCKPSIIVLMRQMQLSLPVSKPKRRDNRQNKEVNRYSTRWNVLMKSCWSVGGSNPGRSDDIGPETTLWSTEPWPWHFFFHYEEQAWGSKFPLLNTKTSYPYF